MWLLILKPWNNFFKSIDCPSSPLWWYLPPSRSSYNSQDGTLAEPLLLGAFLDLAMVPSAGHHVPDSYMSLVSWLFCLHHHTSIYKPYFPLFLSSPLPRHPMLFLLSVAIEVNRYRKKYMTPLYILMDPNLNMKALVVVGCDSFLGHVNHRFVLITVWLLILATFLLWNYILACILTINTKTNIWMSMAHIYI